MILFLITKQNIYPLMKEGLFRRNAFGKGYFLTTYANFTIPLIPPAVQAIADQDISLNL